VDFDKIGLNFAVGGNLGHVRIYDEKTKELKQTLKSGTEFAAHSNRV
jgi:hypothetical protein